MKISKVIIVINESKPHAPNTARELRRVLSAANVGQEWIPTLVPSRDIYPKLNDMRGKTADLVIACGGDGTLLQTAHRFRGSGIPIFGINIGYLGFITSIPGSRVGKDLKRILHGEFVISDRTALDLEIQNGSKRRSAWALN